MGWPISRRTGRIRHIMNGKKGLADRSTFRRRTGTLRISESVDGAFNGAFLTDFAFETGQLAFDNAIGIRPITAEEVFITTTNSLFTGAQATISAAGGGVITNLFERSTLFGVSGKLTNAGIAIGAGSGEAIGFGSVFISGELIDAD